MRQEIKDDTSQIIHVEESASRLDKYLADILEDVSRQKIKEAVQSGDILLNNGAAKPKSTVTPGDTIQIVANAFAETPILPESIPLDIVYEDADILVVNKADGMIVHPTETIRTGTLVNALMAHTDSLSDLAGEERKGIVHRLDMDTTGLMVVAKSDLAYRSLIAQFKNRTVEKHYLTVVHGTPSEDHFEIDAPIGRHPVKRKQMTVTEEGKPARSTVTVLDRKDGFSLLDVEIHSGRTHQIRVHMQHVNYPVVGDETYGGRKTAFNTTHQLLHAYRLAIDHPRTGERISWKTHPHDEFVHICEILGLQLPE